MEAAMKILIAVDMPWYDEIVRDLRKNNEVDYIFKCFDKFHIENRNYHIPKLLGFHRGYLLLAGLIVNWLLLTRNYDFCLTDYRSAYLPTIFPIIRRFMRLVKTSFIFDIRTIPVDYDAQQAALIERKFYQQVLFANRFYQGMTVITPEMKRYLQNKCTGLMNQIGIWESGVDTELFKPLPRNSGLKRKIGFDDDDFVCFYHGSLSNARGVIELVEAFRIIKEREQSIKLLILGRGESTPRLLQIIKDSDMGDSVKIHDWVANNEVPQFISTADLCIIPLPDIDWWRVSSPLKLMEYIACGKNILMTDIVAHVNAVGRNDNYFWIHETTAESYAKSIIACYKTCKIDPQGYYEMGITGRESFVDKITWEQRSLSLQEYFSEITESA
jgi:glycosyltransferase involved in cell wall biosynthesis